MDLDNKGIGVLEVAIGIMVVLLAAVIGGVIYQAAHTEKKDTHRLPEGH